MTTANPRAKGARNALIGAALFAPGVLLFVVARDWLLRTFGTTVGGSTVVELPKPVAVVIGGPMTVGYILLMTGVYAIVFGERGRAQTALWSVFRILFGLVVTIGLIVVAIVIFAALRG